MCSKKTKLSGFTRVLELMKNNKGSLSGIKPINATQRFSLGSPSFSFGTFVLRYFFREETKKGIIRTTKNRVVIISIFVYGIIFMLLIATRSFLLMV